jgi:hypothetical protein
MKWYIHTYSGNCTEAQRRWPEKPALTCLIGESPKASSPLRLHPQPTPEPSWTIRGVVRASDWDRLKTFVVGRAGHLCEYCSAGGTLYVHDTHEYVPSRKYRKLVRLSATCSKCREALAACGYPAKVDFSAVAARQLQFLRGLSAEEARREYADALERLTTPENLNGEPWVTDTSILTDSGISLK